MGQHTAETVWKTLLYCLHAENSTQSHTYLSAPILYIGKGLHYTINYNIVNGIL